MAAAVLLVGLTGGIAAADVGGSGVPATPWRFSPPRDAAELEKVKADAARHQTLFLTLAPMGRPAGSNEVLEIPDVSLAPLPPRPGDPPGDALVGRTRSGQPVRVSFSQIAEFRVLQRSARSLTLSVLIWPDITPQELLRRSPSYRMLRAGHRRSVEMLLPLDAGSRPLAFRRGREEGGGVALGRLSVGARGDFYGGKPDRVDPRRFWWAIPSVFRDPAYPYRVMVLS
jgi:hypothetical protein